MSKKSSLFVRLQLRIASTVIAVQLLIFALVYFSYSDSSTLTLGNLFVLLVGGGILGGVLAGFAASRNVMALLRSLTNLKREAEVVKRAQDRSRIVGDETPEVSEMATAFNDLLAEHHQQRVDIRDLMLERTFIFQGMSEALIAVDKNETILGLNDAAVQFFGTRDAEARGRLLGEVIRSRPLLELFSRASRTGVAEEAEIAIVLREEEKIFNVRARVLSDDRSGGKATLLFFLDLSHLKRLENVRRDFVANVSHELRTPVTSIKGFVETLLEGALNNPEDCKRFLAIILRHTERLNDIISDLLVLARLENAEGPQALPAESVKIKQLYASTVEFCLPEAEKKNIRLRYTCEGDEAVDANRLLLEQALINLVINGIKYSEPGGSVSLKSKIEKQTLQLSVSDNGIGIQREHLPRIFERFYRIDTARTREDGGSGLGLAIVKHIAKAHGGDIHVESEPGRGSTFSLRIPLS